MAMASPRSLCWRTHLMRSTGAVIAVVAVFSLPVIMLAQQATRKAGVDWPIFLGPTQDSKSPETGIITKWTSTKPRIVWSKPLGTSYGAPTIAKGRLFQFDRFGNKARVYCLNAETGKQQWQYEY